MNRGIRHTRIRHTPGYVIHPGGTRHSPEGDTSCTLTMFNTLNIGARPQERAPKPKDWGSASLRSLEPTNAPQTAKPAVHSAAVSKYLISRDGHHPLQVSVAELRRKFDVQGLAAGSPALHRRRCGVRKKSGAPGPASVCTPACGPFFLPSRKEEHMKRKKQPWSVALPRKAASRTKGDWSYQWFRMLPLRFHLHFSQRSK